jgi:spore maturation protein CgeB
MDIAITLKYPLNSIHRQGNVVGDELFAKSLSKALIRTGKVRVCELVAPGAPLTKRVDVLIHFNNTLPDTKLARTNVLYMQNGYGKGSQRILRKLRKRGYDGYAFISNKLLSKHREDGHSGIWMPFGVDTSFFYPREPDPQFQFEIAYVGNDIKGRERTERYILPATKYNFGLYGNWVRPTWKRKVRDMAHLRLQPAYRGLFSNLSRGKIEQEDVPILYSSAKININCTIKDCVDWDVITLRTFEVLACGGFLLTDEVPSLKKVCGDALVVTSGNEDMENKIDYYLAHEKERLEIAEMGPQVANRFSIDAMASRFVDYLQEII